MEWCAIWSDGHLEPTQCHGNTASVTYVSVLQEGVLPILSSSGMMKLRPYLEKMELLVTLLQTHKFGSSKVGLRTFVAKSVTIMSPIEHIWAILE